uniref:Uncharacterized protein n=1 Tax=Setaria viridis TaxID=4556 RepID=A0A4U6UIF1_SETVI|nr:hypothetical protein SEVIR_5G273650v2 [Setaria viridis]
MRPVNKLVNRLRLRPRKINTHSEAARTRSPKREHNQGHHHRHYRTRSRSSSSSCLRRGARSYTRALGATRAHWAPPARAAAPQHRRRRSPAPIASVGLVARPAF